MGVATSFHQLRAAIIKTSGRRGKNAAASNRRPRRPGCDWWLNASSGKPGACRKRLRSVLNPFRVAPPVTGQADAVALFDAAAFSHARHWLLILRPQLMEDVYAHAKSAGKTRVVSLGPLSISKSDFRPFAASIHGQRNNVVP